MDCGSSYAGDPMGAKKDGSCLDDSPVGLYGARAPSELNDEELEGDVLEGLDENENFPIS